MKYLWAFCIYIVFSLICRLGSGASIDITTILPLEDLEDTTELIVSDYNNDDADELNEEGT